MSLPRPFSILRTADQWRRAAYSDAALLNDTVQLAWQDEDIAEDALEEPLPQEGMAFDENCRLYATVRAEGRVERWLWAASGKAEPVDLITSPTPAQFGDFSPTSSDGTHAMEPVAVAVDENQRLWLADAAAKVVHVLDLWSHRLIQTFRLDATPMDLAANDGRIYALVADPPGLLIFDGRSGSRREQLPAGVASPSRLAVSPTGELLVLDRGGAPDARIVTRTRIHNAARATDIEFVNGDVLVIARWPGQDFLRVRWTASEISAIGSLKAKNYDGRGIVATPDDRIVFRTALGLRHAVPGRLRLFRTGRVTAFRFDTGTFQSTWGRVFLDACIPRETSVQIHCIAADEPPDEPALPRTPPSNVVALSVPRPDLSPPMPPVSFVPTREQITGKLHRRETDFEIPWITRPGGDRFETYEAPILAAPGRYLWITIQLGGDGILTPRIRAIRAEHESHELMRRLPALFAREDAADAFLRRYLAMFDGSLADLDARSFARRMILDSRSAPHEMLSWLAGFVGLLVDERWPVAVKRQLIEEAVWLFRFRGTIMGLRRFLEIYLGRTVTILEKYRMRGLGGALVGESNAPEANSVLGAGFRIGGAVGVAEGQFIQGSADDAFASHAHRFTVVIQAVLTSEQMAVVQHILDVHRPAHTLVDVCTVGAGMRVGRGLHVDLTSIVGPTGGFQTARLGSTPIGRNAILGRPAAGIFPGAGRLGGDTRVG